VSHRPSTYARWADTAPEHFRFSVKIPREITHKRKLLDSIELLDQFLAEVTELGAKLGLLLVQLRSGNANSDNVFHNTLARVRATVVACCYVCSTKQWRTDEADAASEP
jgi:uncharacterized protein YecE (DUF72 family)